MVLDPAMISLIVNVLIALLLGWLHLRMPPTPATPDTPPAGPTKHPLLDSILAASKLAPEEKVLLQGILDRLPAGPLAKA